MLEIFVLFFTICFFLSWMLCRLIRSVGPRIGLVDKPGYRKIHNCVMPTGGGIGIGLAMLIPFIVGALLAWLAKDWLMTQCAWILMKYKGLSDSSMSASMFSMFAKAVELHLPGFIFQTRKLFTLLGLGSVLLILGTLDDRYGLNWKIRLFVQFLTATAAVLAGWRATCFVDLPWLTGILSVFWIVGLINSFNMMDNMDGLSGGVALICTLFLAAVMLFFARNPESGQPQLFLGGFLLAQAGAISGFLIHNRPPAKLFMGDGGAYFIGFILAVTTLSATFVGGHAPKQAIFVPLCILAVPLYDLISVVFIRLINGKSPFEGDKNHYSHRLVRLGLSKKGAVLTIYLTTTICSLSALFLYQVSWISACLILIQVALILSLVAILEFYGNHKKD